MRDARLPTGWKPVLLVPRGLDDLGEAARVEAGAADQCAVDIRLAHQFARILRFHATSVLDPHTLGRCVVGHLAQGVTNKRMRLLRLVWRSVATSPDGPNRLVRDHGLLQFLCAQPGEAAA